MALENNKYDDAVENQAEGRWKEFTGKAQEVYGDLTDDWSEQFNGNMKQAQGFLQRKYGDAQQKLAEFWENDKDTGVDA